MLNIPSLTCLLAPKVTLYYVEEFFSSTNKKQQQMGSNNNCSLPIRYKANSLVSGNTEIKGEQEA